MVIQNNALLEMHLSFKNKRYRCDKKSSLKLIKMHIIFFIINDSIEVSREFHSPINDWLFSDDALMDKAKELDISTYGLSTENLRYEVKKKLSA